MSKGWIMLAVFLAVVNVAIIVLMAQEKQHVKDLKMGWLIKELAETKANYFECIDECGDLRDSLNTILDDR